MSHRTTVGVSCLVLGQLLLAVALAYLWLGASLVDGGHGRKLDAYQARALVVGGHVNLGTASDGLIENGYAKQPLASADDLGIWMSQGTAYVSVQIMSVAGWMVAGSMALGLVPLILTFRRRDGGVP